MLILAIFRKEIISLAELAGENPAVSKGTLSIEFPYGVFIV